MGRKLEGAGIEVKVHQKGRGKLLAPRERCHSGEGGRCEDPDPKKKGTVRDKSTQ